MKKAEKLEISSNFINIYKGILSNNKKFEEGLSDQIVYHFECPEFSDLREKYNLVDIAGKGSDYTKAKRLLHYLAPRLTHSSYYDNHIDCNALALLEYSLNNPDQGINCLNKSKILQECCLALGIYARRVSIMPYSPYDFDNHVVNEVYDRKLRKWIMLDVTTDGYFIDENKTPLSLLEMRDKFANDQFITFVHSKNKLTDLAKLEKKHLDVNSYICKNLAYFSVEKESTFGRSEDRLYFVPENFSLKHKNIANLKYRISHLPKEYETLIAHSKKELIKFENSEETISSNILVMEQSPL